jgi:hypothetical protein
MNQSPESEQAQPRLSINQSPHAVLPRLMPIPRLLIYANIATTIASTPAPAKVFNVLAPPVEDAVAPLEVLEPEPELDADADGDALDAEAEEEPELDLEELALPVLVDVSSECRWWRGWRLRLRLRNEQKRLAIVRRKMGKGKVVWWGAGAYSMSRQAWS